MLISFVPCWSNTYEFNKYIFSSVHLNGATLAQFYQKIICFSIQQKRVLTMLSRLVFMFMDLLESRNISIEPNIEASSLLSVYEHLNFSGPNLMHCISLIYFIILDYIMLYYIFIIIIINPKRSLRHPNGPQI